MSICKTTAGALARTRVAANISTTKTLAPFLYQTRTIQQWHPVTDRTARRHASSYRRTDDPIPFERDADLPPAIKGTEPPRKTTMTGTEREAFKKLYKNVKQKVADPLSDDFLDDEALGPGTSIDSLFDAVLSGRASAKQRSLKRPVENLKTLAESILQQEARQAPPQQKPESETETETEVPVDPVQELNRARDAERFRVHSLMLAAKTDHDVWQILEREVFAPIRALDLDGLQAQQDHLARQVRTSYRHKYKIKRLDKPRFRRVNKERKEMREKWAAVLQTFRDADEIFSSIPSPSSTTPPSGPDPRILFHNLPTHLLFTARHLQRNFPTSPLPLSLLATLKSLGRSSAALGATTHLYNLLIRTVWTQALAPAPALAQIDELLVDMENGGIEFDANTWALVNEVVREWRWVRAGRAGKVLGRLYGFEGVLKGVGKLEGWRAIMERRLRIVAGGKEGEREREPKVRMGMGRRVGEREGEFIPFERPGSETLAPKNRAAKGAKPGKGSKAASATSKRTSKKEFVPFRYPSETSAQEGQATKAGEKPEEEELDREVLFAEGKRD